MKKTITFDQITEFQPVTGKNYLLRVHDCRFPPSTDTTVIIGEHESDYILYENTVFYPPNFPTLYKSIYNRNLESAIESLP
jgi:hypothetical protein